MQFDFSALSARDRYKLMISTIVPRPIAWVTSLNAARVLNAAPFSFFNAMGSDPPLIVFAPGNQTDGSPKDTAANIRERGEFVVHLVNDELAVAMNISATDFPADESEVEAASLETLPSVQVQVPRLAAAPVAFECRKHSIIEIGNNRLVVGEILQMHLRDDLLDAEKLYVHTEKLHAIGRMHGGGWYTRTSDLFEIPRLSYKQWREQNDL